MLYPIAQRGLAARRPPVTPVPGTRRAPTAATFFASLLLTFSAPQAQAAEFILTYTGSFATADRFGAAGEPLPNFAGPTSFTARARFNDNGPNLAAPLAVPGFVSYAPSTVTIEMGGVTYSLDSFGPSAPDGVAVSIFDTSNVFFPGRYGVGLFADPVADGAGFVADFLGADPGFSVTSLRPTTFTSYQGAGFLAGVGCFFGPVCTPAPLSLRDAAGNPFALQLTTRIEEFANGAPLHTAQITAVPEPSTWGMMLLGFGVAGSWLRVHRRASARKSGSQVPLATVTARTK